jgi:hypothetical protein
MDKTEILLNIMSRAVLTIQTKKVTFSAPSIVERIEKRMKIWASEAEDFILIAQAWPVNDDIALGEMFAIISTNYSEEDAMDIYELILTWWDDTI